MTDGTLKVGTITTRSGSGTITIGQSGETVDMANGSITLNSDMKATPAFKARLSADQTIANVTDTTVACNTEDLDTAGCYNNTGSTVTLNGISTPAYSFAPNVAGIYFIGCKMFQQTDANHYSVMYAYNSGTRIIESQFHNELGNARPHFASTIVSMNGTSNYIYMETWQNSGTSKLTYSTLPNTHFFGYLLKAT